MTEFDSGFVPAGINWQEFSETLPALINTTTEAMIAEIVDNALDQESEDRKLKVKIELYGSSWDDLAIIVYDNGKGFIDEENMDKSFELSNRPGMGGKMPELGNSILGSN